VTQTAAQRHVVAATSISYIVVVLDTSIVNVALEKIAGGLQTDLSGLQWVVNAYTLTFASLLLSGGTLGDRWGARRFYMAGLALFTAASAMGGFASSLAMLTVARILQGVGAAMLVPCSLTLLNHAFPDPKERAAVIAVWAGCGGAALAAGPLAGPHAQPQAADPNLPSVPPEALQQLSETRIRQQIMQRSQEPDRGRCVCSSQTEDSNGRSCKGRYQPIRSAPKPLCTPQEVTQAMIDAWQRKQH
jgi:hypothetical protein